MFFPYIQPGLWGNIWTNTLEPDRLIGPSLSLICLVIRHQGSCGCPSPESGTHEEGLRTPPACGEQTGRRARKSFSGVAFANATVSCGPCSTATSTLHRCLVQRTCCDPQPQSSQLRSLGKVDHQILLGRLPRPRDALVCPLDNGGLTGVRP